MIRDDVKALAAGKNLPTISTLLPGGQIQRHVVWVDCDDDHVVAESLGFTLVTTIGAVSFPPDNSAAGVQQRSPTTNVAR